MCNFNDQETFSKSTAGNEGRTLKSLFKWINPLTKSASSTIPLAVMLKETVSAHFKKTDENRLIVLLFILKILTISRKFCNSFQ